MDIICFKLILLFVTVAAASYIKRHESNCTNLSDVIVVADASDSISDADYAKLKNGLVKLAESLTLSDESQQLGITVFSSHISDTVPLSSDLESLKSEISALDHPKEGTRTDKGIRKMIEMFDDRDDGREGVPKVGIVITDGDSKNRTATLAAANDAKAHNISMISVRIGSKSESTEFTGIASSPSNVIYIANFDELQALVSSLVKKICPVDGGWTSWSKVNEGQCSATCGNGTKTLSYTRTCTNPSPKNGGNDCVGSSSKTETTDCWEKNCPEMDPCAGCHFKNGIGYMPHPSDCRYFLQCKVGGSHEVMQCNWGGYWNEEHLTCTTSRKKCQENIPYYVGPKPTVTIPASCDGSTRPFSGKDNQYLQKVPGHDWVLRDCPPGTVYDSANCTCVHGGTAPEKDCKAEIYLPFSGKVKDESGKNVYVENGGVKIEEQRASFVNGGFLRINRFANMDFRNTLVIDFRMNVSYTPTSNEAIVTNADCDKEASIYIILRKDGKTVDFSVVNEDQKTTTLLAAYMGGWSRVRLVINNGIMKATVGNDEKSVEFKGNIAKSHCAIQIGQGDKLGNFHGSIDDFKISQCVV